MTFSALASAASLGWGPALDAFAATQGVTPQVFLPLLVQEDDDGDENERLRFSICWSDCILYESVLSPTNRKRS